MSAHFIFTRLQCEHTFTHQPEQHLPRQGIGRDYKLIML